MRRLTRTLLPSLTILALLALLGASPALAGGPQLAGAWEAVASFDGGGAAPFLATFDKDGTWTSSGASSSASTAHGAWEKSGPRSYSTKSVIFFYDANGNLSLRGESRSEIEVSQDGNSYSGTFEATITLLDGTVVATNSGTEAGSRIQVD